MSRFRVRHGLGVLLVAATFALLIRVGWSGLTYSSEVSTGTILADPSPVRVCDGSGMGRVRIAWFRESFGEIEVRIDSVWGSLFVRGGPHGSQETGKWVRDGMRFVLVEAESGRVLSSVTASVTEDGCDRNPRTETRSQ